MKRSLIILALSASPAVANPALETVCRDVAAVVYRGVEDGRSLHSFETGAEWAVGYIPTQPHSEERKMMLSAYMAGYAQGLIGGDSFATAADFFNTCISEGA
ncbi:hypothetical protein [Paracoccus versutus]|uniref:Rap1a immunity protein domain-containing protein n=1 Tax=Paracoccus versutus TaxID=34007 RepID=A0A3D9XRN5_PARVE|nr:hypothetical protein [Paracoccus versutus]REF72361.1 hypothetical protein BDD41_0831 [Paracoccus versutus]WGR55661.1 hypothetical protein E3U25_06690 [Paracoccus versutus]